MGLDLTRRGFLTGLGAVGIAAPTLALGKPNPRGFTWKTICSNGSCGEPLSQFIDMTGPLKVGNQCPKCLFVLDTTTLVEKIREFNGQDQYGRPINGGKRARYGRDIRGNRIEL